MEYALPLLIVGVSVMLSMGLLSGTMQNTVVASMGSDATALKDKSVQVRMMGQIDMDPTQVNLKLADGTIMPLAEYPLNLRQSIETDGVDGTTNKILASYDTALKQMLADGKITQAQFNQLSQLSNSGHRIAAFEHLLTQVSQNTGTSKTAFHDTVVQFEGNSYSVANLSYAAGYGWWPPDQLTNTPISAVNREAMNALGINPDTVAGNGSSMQSMGFLMADFVNAYKAAMDSGAMSDPAVQQMVQAMSGDIKLLADHFSAQAWQVQHPDGTSDPSHLVSNTAGAYTDGHSSQICNKGGTLDTGVYCPPTG